MNSKLVFQYNSIKQTIMGIPTYFRYLFDKYSNEIIQIDNKPNQRSHDYFLIDFNSLCYNCYYENPTLSKESLVKKIFDYTLDLCKTVNPKQLLYIAVDGPIPFAKIHQQRSRRYKGTVFEVLKVDNASITYKVIRHFQD